MSQSAWGVAAAVVLAAVLLLAGVSKVARPAEWRAQAAGLGVPGLLAAVVPFVEVALGAALVVQWQRRGFAWAAFGLLCAFSGLLVLRLSQGRQPPCACFGALTSRPIGVGHLARNALLIATAVLAATL